MTKNAAAVTTILLYASAILFGLITSIRLQNGEAVTSARVLFPFIASMGSIVAGALRDPRH